MDTLEGMHSIWLLGKNNLNTEGIGYLGSVSQYLLLRQLLAAEKGYR
jgi:hypothetical protein